MPRGKVAKKVENIAKIGDPVLSSTTPIENGSVGGGSTDLLPATVAIKSKGRTRGKKLVSAAEADVDTGVDAGVADIVSIELPNSKASKKVSATTCTINLPKKPIAAKGRGKKATIIETTETNAMPIIDVSIQVQEVNQQHIAATKGRKKVVALPVSVNEDNNIEIVITSKTKGRKKPSENGMKNVVIAAAADEQKKIGRKKKESTPAREITIKEIKKIANKKSTKVAETIVEQLNGDDLETAAAKETVVIPNPNSKVAKKRGKQSAEKDAETNAVKEEATPKKKAKRAGTAAAAVAAVDAAATVAAAVPKASPKSKRAAKATINVIEQETAVVEELDTIKNVRGRKRAAATINPKTATVDDVNDDVKSSKVKKAAPLNATNTNYNKSDFELPPLENSINEERFNLKISSWNVAGLRSWLKKDGLKFIEYEEPDIFCLQEIKCTTDQMPEEAQRISGYHPYWLCLPGGYAGVAIYSKIMPINVVYGIGNDEFDQAGRILSAEYEKFFLVNVYVPNSGRKLVNLEPRMRWEKLFQQHIQNLNERKPVIICGDLNVSHQELDLANPKSNTRNAGFTKEEREKMSELLSLGYVDTFRELYPDKTGAYTFWSYMGNARARNVGWRLDYFLVSERIRKRVVDNCIRSKVLGSDHCPITLYMKL